MAKRRGRKGRGMAAIPFQDTLALSTLADNTVLQTTFWTPTRDFYPVSAHIEWAIRGLTAGEGPVKVGLAHAGYSVTEITEFLDAEYTAPDALTAREQGRRMVRRSGTFHGLSTEEVINDGRPLKTIIKFPLTGGQGLAAWAVNRSGAALTTGAVIKFSGTIYGRWR